MCNNIVNLAKETRCTAKCVQDHARKVQHYNKNLIPSVMLLHGSVKEFPPPYARKLKKLTGVGAKSLAWPALRRLRGQVAPEAGNR